MVELEGGEMLAAGDLGLTFIKNGEVKNSSSTSSEFEILCRFVYSK